MEHTSKSIISTESSELAEKTIVLCITGSVAAVKCPEIARALMRKGAEVIPVMTRNSKKIIHPDLMEWATGNPVITELTGKIEHVQYCGKHEKKADLLLIAPATSNTISKIACGIDDTVVTTFAATALGSKIPIIIVPAMHESMYTNPVIKKNMEALKKIGILFIEPDIRQNKARLKPTESIVKTVCSIFQKKDLKNKKIIITAGATREYIDPVRYITNPGSGKTGFYLAEAACSRGADVTLITGNTDKFDYGNYKVINIKTTQDMYNSIKNSLKNTDILIHTASVSDFAPQKHSGKIPTEKPLSLKLKPTTKILDKIKGIKKGVFLVGFKAEYSVTKSELIKRAKEKLEKSCADMIVANDVSEIGCGFGTEENRVIIIEKSGRITETEKLPKKELAHIILDKISNQTKT